MLVYRFYNTVNVVLFITTLSAYRMVTGSSGVFTAPKRWANFVGISS